MAFTLNNLVGFETGALEETKSSIGSPSVSGGGKQRTGDFCLVSTSLETTEVVLDPFIFISDAGDSQCIGFAFFKQSESNSRVVYAQESGTFCWIIRSVGTDGSMSFELIDAGNNTIGTSTKTDYNFDEWYYIEVIWQHSDTGDIDVVITPDSTGVAVTQISLTGEDLSAGGTFNEYKIELKNSGPSQSWRFDDVYMASGLTATSDRLGGLEVFALQTTTTGTTADAGGQGNAKTGPLTGVWEDTADTPLNAGTDIEHDGDSAGGSVDTAALDASGDFDGDSNIVAIKGIFHLDRDGGGNTAHWVALGDSGDGDSPAAIDEDLTQTPTTYIQFRTTDLPQVSVSSQAVRMGIWNIGARDSHIYEMWAMIGHVPDTGGALIGRSSGLIISGMF